MPAASYSEMKLIPTAALITRFAAVPIPVPCARSRSGRISDPYIHITGPNPSENVAMNAAAAATLVAAAHHSEPEPEDDDTRREKPRTRSDTAMPPALESSIGRRPRRSARKSGTTMEAVLVAPRRTVAPSTARSDVTPTWLNTRGAYSTIAATPDACWKNCRPRMANSTRRTAGVGRTRMSRHTPVDAPPPPAAAAEDSCCFVALSLTDDTISWRRRSARAASPPVVRTSTWRASSWWPCRTSQRGVSGMASSAAAARKSGGTAPMPIMRRQLSDMGRPASAKSAM
ncbi:Os12g0512150 [Oryza sativa Japonica Group]|uniref:Os12g0512150 protein n=1 Tax=Oryza sativa subsp. japonica TaxID=39947 RepID=A0A0N7KU38_ORYSJ|nr:hypothetical protein EE612_059845 [Oryza sativa]BAT17338.1 Os12g0512150 [Oryza sativa Japonica Group]